MHLRDAHAAVVERNSTALAKQLGISQAAADLYVGSDVIDLHIDSFIWHRAFGYDLTRRHGKGILAGCVYSQVDFPRILEAAITGATWVITTNPFRESADRAQTLLDNLRTLRGLFASVAEHFELVRNAQEYHAARARGRHAAFVGIQGGNALDAHQHPIDLIDEGVILRITLVHLLPSDIGMTSTPMYILSDRGLSRSGPDYVEALNKRRIFVDLAHISKRGFWEAVRVHDRSLPILVSHTALDAVHRHWRNLDDDQLRAIADSGGTVGVLYHAPFLGDPLFSGRASSVVRHLEHIARTVGAQFASLGSDWDGAICPPVDLRSCLELPRLVQIMLERRWREDDIRWVLGQSFLRALTLLRG